LITGPDEIKEQKEEEKPKFVREGEHPKIYLLKAFPFGCHVVLGFTHKINLKQRPVKRKLQAKDED
jgi:hypothetical protein